MKKMFLAAAAALAMLASCSKDADEIADTAKGGVVKITLTDKTPAMTRAFFGTTAAAESWEKKIGSLTLFVFDGSDRAVLQRRFSAAEISGQAATIPVPDAKPGELYKFYVVANSGNPANVADLTELRSSTESEAASYNGTFDEVTTKAVRSGGFTMTGSTMKAIAQAGQTTDVQIGIERLVAKIAVQTATDSKFAAAYPGRVKIASRPSPEPPPRPPISTKRSTPRGREPVRPSCITSARHRHRKSRAANMPTCSTCTGAKTAIRPRTCC